MFDITPCKSLLTNCISYVLQANDTAGRAYRSSLYLGPLRHNGADVDTLYSKQKRDIEAASGIPCYQPTSVTIGPSKESWIAQYQDVLGVTNAAALPIATPRAWTRKPSRKPRRLVRPQP